MGVCGRALRVVAGTPRPALRSLEVDPLRLRNRALPGTFRRPLTRHFKGVRPLGVVQTFGAAASSIGGAGDTVEPVSLAAFALVDALPTLLLWCAAVVLVAVALRNRLVVALTALALLGFVVWCAPRVPVYLLGALIPVSDFADFGSDLATRFTSTETLLQRGSMMVVAAGLVAVAAVLHPRLDKTTHWRHLVWGITLTALGTLGIALLAGRAVAGIELREGWLASHSRAAAEEGTTRADIEHLTGNVVIEPGTMLELDVTMILRTPRPHEGGDRGGPRELTALVFSLNPGLRVTALRLDGAETGFTHRHGLLSVALATPMKAGSRAALSLRAVGVPDWRFAHLDGAIDPLRVSASNRLGALGRKAAIFEDSYVGLMPAIHWLPASGANVHRDDPARRTRDFFVVDLTVHAPHDWLVVAVGRRQRIGQGTFRFESRVPVSEVGLFASRFSRQAIEVDGIEFELLMHAVHSHHGELFADAGEVVGPRLEEMHRRLEHLGIGYPFDSLSIVEVPMQLRTYRGGWRMETERGPPSVMVLKENAYSLMHWQHRMVKRYLDRDLDDAELMLGWLWNLADDLNILRKYSSNLVAVTGARDHGAVALDFVCEELAVALLLGETLQYLEIANSAHGADGEDGLGNVVAAMLAVLVAGDMGPLFGHSLSFADRPHVWEHALDTPLSNPETSGGAKRAVEVLALKGTRAAHAILDRFGRDKAGVLLAELRERYAGRTYRAEDFAAVGEAVGASAASVLGNWLSSTAAPGFLASPASVVRLRDDDSGDRRYQTRVHVRNDEPTAGAAFLGVDRQAWMERTDAFPVPGNSSVELGMVTLEPPSQLWLHSYFSRNRIPVRLELPAGVDHTAEESGSLVGVGPSDWRPPTAVGIVIDDLDPGFAVEADGNGGWRGGIMARFRPELRFDQGLPQYYWWSLEGTLGGEWLRQEVPSSWGKYRHTMARATAGYGDHRAVFATELAGGRWRLDFHLPHDPLQQLPGEGYVEPSFIGQLGRYEMWLRTAAGDRPIEFDGSAAAQGWNKLGVFDLQGGRVSVVVSNRTTGDIVIADAVNWLPLSAANSP